MGILDLFKRKSFPHGIHPPEYKEQTRDQPLKRLPFAPRFVVPLSQHFGAPAKAIVRPGQEVARGEPIAEADGHMSVPMHAPVTGEVEAVALMPTARGPKSEAIILRPFGGSSQEVLYGGALDLERLDEETIIREVQACGMVGLGGAGFPTHVKLSVPEGHKVDTLLVNGCECEPYLTADHRLMVERPEELMTGIRVAMRAARVERAIIGVEDNKPEAAEAMRKVLPEDGSISVEVVETKYPQGSEKMLIKAVLGREVPSGGFPYQVGVVVNNVSTLAEIGRLLPRREGLIERIVTVAGPGIEHPGNYLVPIGTPLRFLLERVGCASAANQVILGGPMMGATVASLDVPVTKAVSGVVILPERRSEERQSAEMKVQPCIKCGRCLDACPLHLNPSMLGRLAAKRHYGEMAEKYHLNDCFECGSCSYVCPSNIPLVQYFRIAKSINRERTAA
ncbi:electron transport complex subunit RsxC [Endothiovibrio diazotrophicus]